MNGYERTYLSLFDAPPVDAPRIDWIQIPIFQRDYAQGRPDADARKVRSDFLPDLFDAICGITRLPLDFIYGKVKDGVFEPLDGQQRLTTLYLIHWYVASLAGVLDPKAPARWTRFTYRTRPSARRFCKSLVKHPLPPGQAHPAAWIENQPWYLYTWQDDPTIQSMLVMLDAIDDEARRRGLHEKDGAEAAWERLADANSPAISFHFLALGDMESAEELYIKMNSRGKTLTDFEIFKAQLEKDIAHSPDYSGKFESKVDATWTDLVWAFRGKDDIVDIKFMRYLDYITEICEWRDEFLRDNEVEDRSIRARAKAIFGEENENSTEHLGFLLHAFDDWRDEEQDLQDREHVDRIFAEVFALVEPGATGYDSSKVRLFGLSDTEVQDVEPWRHVNLFDRCLRKFDGSRRRGREFALKDSLLLYAVLLHVTKKTEDFPRRVRTLRNLLEASEDEIRWEDMPDLLEDVDALITDGALERVETLSKNQREDEHAKAMFLESHPELASAVSRLEDHELLRGTLSVFERDPDTFERRAEAFESAFAHPENYIDLTRALLVTGPYQRRRYSNYWQFGTAAKEGKAAWRHLLAEASSKALEDTRRVLGQFLDGFAASGEDFHAYVEHVVDTWLSERERDRIFDWRYYLVRYEVMRGAREQGREGRTGIYWADDGEPGYSLGMLRTTILTGRYRDPFLLQVWLNSGSPEANDLWYTWTGPRWLQLKRSSVGLRNIAEGFELRGPEGDNLEKRFREVCRRHKIVTEDDGRIVLRIPQVNHIDSVDRVVRGAAFVTELVNAGR